MPLLYFGKRLESARAGLCLVGVECDECGCEYSYELARIGSGGATAPYGIGKAAAARSSQQQSQRDLRKRLAYEAELVPCPKCNWINEELVHGYRLGRFRWVGILALGVGMIGTVSSLMGAWFMSIGPAADRAAVPYLLFGGPLVFVSLGVAMILLRVATWSNPTEPGFPPGTAIAARFATSLGHGRRKRRTEDGQTARRGTTWSQRVVRLPAWTGSVALCVLRLSEFRNAGTCVHAIRDRGYRTGSPALC